MQALAEAAAEEGELLAAAEQSLDPCFPVPITAASAAFEGAC
jgi:hypothetical protein